MTKTKYNWHASIHLCLGYMDGFKFIAGLPPEPNKRPYVFAKIPANLLHKYGILDYFKGIKGKSIKGQKLPSLPNAESFWIGGMQKWVASTIWLVTDDPKSGIFVFYAFQNNDNYMQFLGKLKKCSLKKIVLKKFKRLCYQ